MSKKKKEVQLNRPLAGMGVYDASAIFTGAYIVMLLLQFLFYVVLAVTNVEAGFDKTAAYACITVVINEVAFVSAPFLYSKIKSRRVWNDCGISDRVDVVQILLAVGIGAAALFAFSPAATLFNSLFTSLGFSASVMPSAQNVPTLIAYVFICSLLPAFCEEFLFRGHVARGFAKRGYVFGLIVSSLLFALMHGSPVQFVYQFFLGAVACWIYFVTRSLWTGVAVHATSNLIVLITDYALTASGTDYLTVTGRLIGIYAGVTVAGIALLIGLCYVAYAYTAKKRGLKAELSAIKGFTPSAWSERFDVLYSLPDDRAKRKSDEEFRNSQIETAPTPEVREMLIARFESEDKQEKKKDNKGLVFCFVITGVMFLLNTILGFMQ